jgi:menaquinone-dependent protoporphyrinogen IX oxidase
MQTHKILVAYTTNAGSTAEAARLVGEELGQDGTQVEVRRLEEVTSLESYTAVVVGGPMILGWHRAAQKFVRQHQAELARIPSAYFLTAMSLTDTGQVEYERVPVCIDPSLAKPPARPGHLSFKENYATVANYLKPVIQLASPVRPANVAIFGGRLEMFRLKWWQMLFVLVLIQAKPGGSYNKPFIRQWAANLRPAFNLE